MRSWVLVGALLAAADAGSSASDGGVDCRALFVPPPGGVLLCDEHVMSPRAEIHWKSWSVEQTPDEAFARLQALAKACGATVKGRSAAAGSGDVSVHTPTDASAPSCSHRPDAKARAVVIISELFSR